MEDLLNLTVPAAEESNTTISVMADDEEDTFKLLPDEIIISHIFDKVSEVKSLCSCLLVSKNFSSLVYQTKTVSIKIPLDKTPNQLLNNPTTSFPGKLFHFITTPLRLAHGLFLFITKKRPRPSLVGFDADYVYHLITKFLVKFTSLKSLHMEFNFSRLNFDMEPVVKWKMASKSAGFILLIAKSLDLAATDDHVGADNDNISANERKLLEMQFNFHMSLATFRFAMMEMLVPFLPKSLGNVVVTDSKNQGKLELEESDLFDMRNGITNSNDDAEVKIRFWQAPSLKLPLSGSVMKIVTVLICNDTAFEMGDYLMVKEALEGEDEVFAEAVMEMTKKEVISEQIVRAQDL